MSTKHIRDQSSAVFNGLPLKEIRNICIFCAFLYDNPRNRITWYHSNVLRIGVLGPVFEKDVNSVFLNCERASMAVACKDN
jgi:hypothetical protein